MPSLKYNRHYSAVLLLAKYKQSSKRTAVSVFDCKMHKKCCGLYCRAARITRNIFKTQNPQLINKSSFKLRAAYDGLRTVRIISHHLCVFRLWIHRYLTNLNWKFDTCLLSLLAEGWITFSHYKDSTAVQILCRVYYLKMESHASRNHSYFRFLWLSKHPRKKN